MISESYHNIPFKFKSRPSSWLGTTHPCVVPISIHSEFHSGKPGFEKVKLLLQTVRANTQGRRMALFCDYTHLNAKALEWGTSIAETKSRCEYDARALCNRFESVLGGFEIAYWSQLINLSPRYLEFQQNVNALNDGDSALQESFKSSAERTFTLNRSLLCPDKNAWVNATVTDLVEHCVYLQVLSSMGYRYQLYPGKREACVEEVNHLLLKPEARLNSINVDIKAKWEFLPLSQK